ncbi:MAG TPA: PadR family transcriptional regulator [Acidobacteriaceae bacterium]|jgi:DNA-binding PadR family transcriptional regulator|nr:PadR family transcriptional regulator [Acidobacteriaceae bacterium]
MEYMAEKSCLGEFELMVILSVISLADGAYGVPIARQIEKHREHEVSLSSVYAALDRLEGKGLVRSELGDATPERGGRAKRYYQVTASGLRVIQQTRQTLTALWRDVPELGGVRL